MPMDRETKTELEEVVRLVVQEELTTFAAAFTDLLAPMVQAVREIDRSCRLLIQGQALIEKYIAAQQAEREPWQDAEDDDDADPE